MSWLIQNETKQVIGGAGYSHSDSSSKHRGRSGGVGASSGPTIQRQSYDIFIAWKNDFKCWLKRSKQLNGSRPGSQEIFSACSALPPLNTGAWSNAPSQPFVADPSMPPLPSPNTATQLEEARRRLEDVKGKTVSRQRYCIEWIEFVCHWRWKIYNYIIESQSFVFIFKFVLSWHSPINIIQ